MELSRLENFLLIPKTDRVGATLIRLEPSKGFEKNSFVLIPYQNPQVKLPEPRFFKILEKSPINDIRALLKSETTGKIELQAKTPRAAYLKKVEKLKREIQLGNIYEINYCISFFSENSEIDPVSVFVKLLELSKAPYACLLKTGDDYIIGASPELFLKKENTLLITKPIKGTTKRGGTRDEDEALKASLYNSLKERTENVMAVDVARNDLSHFAKKGSVHVNKLYNIETFDTVHQMVSTVSCEINEKISALPAEEQFKEIVDATFPMASMTGAPKLKAMQLIDAVEDFNRGSYSGTMGLIDENDDYSLSVIIRSIFYNEKSKKLSIAVGGAVTYLSEPQKEYDECLLKAEALLKAIGATIAPDNDTNC